MKNKRVLTDASSCKYRALGKAFRKLHPTIHKTQEYKGFLYNLNEVKTTPPKVPLATVRDVCPRAPTSGPAVRMPF